MRDKFFQWLLGVFDNNPGGGSMRKIQAIIILSFAAAIHVVALLLIWRGKVGIEFSWKLILLDFTMIGLLLGMILFQDIVKLKNGTPVKEEEKKPEN